MGAALYRTKPVRAVQWDGDNADAIREEFKDECLTWTLEQAWAGSRPTLAFWLFGKAAAPRLEVGDWLLFHPWGEEALDDEEFREKYEATTPSKGKTEEEAGTVQTKGERGA